MSSFDFKKDFLECVLPKKETRSPRGVKKSLRRYNSVFYCDKCHKVLPISLLTIEHTIPYVILRASGFTIKPKYSRSCFKCNNNDVIPSYIGTLFCEAQTLASIRIASTRLCDLVRKKDEGNS